jgi:hypothetical protein
MSGVVKFIMLFINKEISILIFFNNLKCEKNLIYKPPKMTKWLFPRLVHY